MQTSCITKVVFLLCGLWALAAVAFWVPVIAAAGTLDEASSAADLSRMRCQVEIRAVGGALSVRRVMVLGELSDDLFLKLKGLHELAALDLWLPTEHSGSARLRELPSLHTVRELSLSGPEVNDQIAKYIGCMTNLESLKLLSASVSETGLVSLANLKTLRHLEVRNLEPITRRGLEAIATLTNLEEISIAGKCEKGALLALRSLEKLVTISVGGTQADDQLAELRTLPRVRTVKISRATITAATANSLLAMHTLESLDLGCCDIEPEAATRMRSLHLKRLDCYSPDSRAYEELLKAVGPDLWDLHASSDN